MKKIKNRPENIKKLHSYKFYLFTAIILIVLAVIISSISVGFMYSVQLIREHAVHSQNEVCERIYYDTDLINRGLEMYDMSLNNRLETDFKYFMDEYEKSGRNPDKMNLSSVAEKTGDDITLYIINESYVITHSTNPGSIGLDFRTYTPYYIKYLSDIINSSGFFPERVLPESETRLHKKFGYMPTPDNKYILEMSLYDENFNNIRKELKYTDSIEKIANNSPYIKDIRIFDTLKREIENDSFSPDAEFSALLNEIFESGTGRDVKDPVTGETVRYLYVPLKSKIYGSDNSLIVEMALDDSPIASLTNSIVAQYVLIVLFSILLCLGCAALISRHFSNEIEGIVSDISVISGGDLDRKIRDTRALEFKKLEESINLMVENIRENIKKCTKAQDVLKTERDRAQMYFSIADVIFIACDIDGIIREINKKSLEVFGYAEEEAVGKDFFDLMFTDENRETIKDILSDYIMSGKQTPLNFRCRAKTRNGKLKDVNLSTVLLKNSSDSLKGWLTTGADVTDELAIKRELELSLNQKNILLREVHHRVKNNLQIIISLFDLKSYCTDDKNLLMYIKGAKSRISAMAIVHEIMYRSDNFTKVNIPEYVKGIVSESLSSFGQKENISVKYDMDEVFFDLDNSVPFGILVNELVSNSISHAFEGEGTGIKDNQIFISLKRADGKIIFTFSDNGCGMPSEDELKGKNTIGLNLIINLVRQLSGVMNVIRENGTTFIIEIEDFGHL
ncbi:PAS domain S-box-containing protein [Methanomicrobium sp. W14]|uniref:sensor histidine kinase n=1 Tax=Methanomicrobium sp. W14 TaxID=2817839 RepID=UPI001AE7F762|nr:histidine kinase dimerization/phosphoacceptor domain -containing protein [Methanomicrobium sp. W14]MBP2133251.1 PAS domain S-box-containing protein [Methanomicrobium sp. W14]